MQFNKYLIAVVPPEPIAGEIFKLKEYFRDRYNSKASLNSPAHITMHMPFEWRTDREELLVETLAPFISKDDPFDIELRDFNKFPPRVIFIDVVRNPVLEERQKQLVQFCKTRLNLLNALYREEPFHPHVTIAFRDLRKDRFLEAWSEFEGRRYSARFECRRLSLLRHTGGAWKEFLTK